jgi:hypothetical protein
LAAFAEYESNLISKRTREINYSAMVSSGKFNSTHKVLGLDQRVVNGEEKVGFYVANDDELKIVTWIMETFLKYSSYQKVLEECLKYEIINKTGKPFKLNSLRTLLTNKKYVGVWVINLKNKEKNQDRLMPYDRYQEIELPHGELLDRELWDRVQERVESIRGRNGKNTRINRVYPLQGILKVYDGTNFHGTSGTPGHKDSSRKVFYYYHKSTGSIRADVLESEVTSVVTKIIKNSKEVQTAIVRRGADVKSTIEQIGEQKSKIRNRIESLKLEKKKSYRRLDFLLDTDDIQMANEFREEFKNTNKEISNKISTYEMKLAEMDNLESDLDEDSFDWKKVGESADKVQSLLAEKDPVALKTSYKQLFKAIYVSVLNDSEALG